MNESNKKRTVQLHTFLGIRTEIEETAETVEAPNQYIAEKMLVNGDPSVKRLAPPLHHTLRRKIKQLPDPKRKSGRR